MSNRERWIIYPLLFFALANAFKQQTGFEIDNSGLGPFQHEGKFRSIECNMLTVNSLDGRQLARLGGATGEAGSLIIYGPNGNRLVVLGADLQGTRGVMEIFSRFNPSTVITSTEGGGWLKLYGEDGQPSLVVGHDSESERSGLLALGRDDVPLTKSMAAQGESDPWGHSFAWKTKSSSVQSLPTEGETDIESQETLDRESEWSDESQSTETDSQSQQPEANVDDV